MGGRGGSLGGGGGGAAVADANIDMGTVTLSGSERQLTGKVVTKFQAGNRAEIEIEVSAKGYLSGRAFGSVVFKVDQDTQTARIVSINSVQQLKGQGVGERLYAQAFAEAKRRGATTFTSDVRVSIPAANAWRRIGQKLGGVTESKSSNDGQQLIGSGGKPVFSMNIGKISQSKLEKLGK